MHLRVPHDLNALKLDYGMESDVHLDEFWQ